MVKREQFRIVIRIGKKGRSRVVITVVKRRSLGWLLGLLKTGNLVIVRVV